MKSEAADERVVSRTERLVLRELDRGDAPFLLELMNEPDYHRLIGDRGLRTLGDAEAYLRSRFAASYRDHGFGLWLVCARESGEPLGICGLVRREGLPDVDVGFAFHSSRRGKGYATEAAAETVRLARSRFALGRLLGITDPRNEASMKVLAKIGMRREANIVLPGVEGESALFVLE